MTLSSFGLMARRGVEVPNIEKRIRMMLASDVHDIIACPCNVGTLI